MTVSFKRLETYVDTVALDLRNQFQEMFSRHVELAFQHKQMDELTYRRFMTEICMEETIEGVFSHYESLYSNLKTYLRNQLLDRIIKGAEYIESREVDDPYREAAMKKYDRLVEELQEFDRRESA